jgi:hypothetical protein
MATFRHAAVTDTRLYPRLADWILSYAVFVDQSSTVALRGVVRSSPDDDRILQFVVIDGVQMAERRRQARIPVAVAVTVSRVAEQDTAAVGLRTETVDLSPGGALLKAEPGALRVGDPVDVTLALPWQATALSAQAQVVRRAGVGVALRFTAMSPDDEASLASFIAAAQFALAPSRL